ncbi:hypothetical protein OF001_U190046 [Pseudomonas sp. OF001]|nr:hypothetical protein OF001_U190046 [Pseudomonas sp. OF001]
MSMGINAKGASAETIFAIRYADELDSRMFFFKIFNMNAWLSLCLRSYFVSKILMLAVS